MNYNTVYNKLHKYNKNSYRQLNICLIISIAFVVSFSSILFGPLVQQVFPEGGDSRKQIYLIYAITIIGCWIFVIYALSLFFKYKSKEIGILLALGTQKKEIGKMLSRELRKMIFESTIIGAFLGELVSIIIWESFRKTILISKEYKYSIDKNGVIVLILFVLMVILTTACQSKKYTKRSNILELIYEQQKSETVKEVGKWYGICGILLIICGILLGYVVPILVAYTQGKSMSGLWNTTYLFSVIGIYMCIVYVIMGRTANKNNPQYYTHIIPYNMTRFQGKQTVKNMCVVTLMLIAGLFSFFYVPQLRAGANIYETSEYDISIPIRADLGIITNDEIKNISNEYNLKVVNYHEIDFAELVGSGIERDWDENDDLIENYQKCYKLYEFINKSDLEKVIGKNIDVEKGKYLVITSSEVNESFWEKNNDLDCITNPINNKELFLEYSGTVESVCLLRNGVKRIVLNDEDYATITEGISDKNKVTQIVFSLSGTKEDKYEFSVALYKMLLENTPEDYAVTATYDAYQENKNKMLGKEYDESEKLELEVENEDLVSYWKYYPIMKPILSVEYLQSTIAFFLIFMYAGLICLVAVVIIEYTRIKMLAISNKKLFDNLGKLGAKKNYLNKCLKEQIRKIIIVPSFMSSIIIIFFTIVILRGNDNKFSILDFRILMVDFLIVMFMFIIQYFVYRFTLEKAKKILKTN